MAENNQTRKPALSQRQTEFIQSFLAEGAPPYQQLVAPQGSGKTLVATSIIQALVRQKGAKKILYLVDRRVSAESTRYILNKMDIEIPVDYVDSKRFRELLAHSPLGGSPWPSAILAFMYIETAKMLEILETILQTEWDLIITDFISHPDSGSKVIKTLLAKKIARRVLILARNGQDFHDSRSGSKLVTTHWNLDSLLPDRSAVELRVQVVDYQRSHEEAEFIQALLRLQELVKGTPLQSSIRWNLASSSLSAAEQSLRQIRNQVVHRDVLSFLKEETESDVIPQEDELAPSPRTKKAAIDPSTFLDAIQAAQDGLRRISKDSKFDALHEYIQSASSARILVLTMYSATMTYLYSSLSEARNDVYLISGLLPNDKVQAALKRFRSEGGVLIASDALVTGVDLVIDEIIYYDLIDNPVILSQAVARLYRLGPSIAQGELPQAKKIVIFRDSSQAIPAEEERLERFQNVFRQITQ